MNNSDLEKLRHEKGVTLWQIGAAMIPPVCEMTVCRWFRTEMPPEKQMRVLAAINRAADSKHTTI